MKNAVAFSLAAGLGLALVSSAHAQNWAPDVDYSNPNQVQAPAATAGFVAIAPDSSYRVITPSVIPGRAPVLSQEQVIELGESGYGGN